ncbi:hypothetical protein O0544_11730 [Edwardsiella anguillarum]|nr:hypothetical protein [Edwardsiella anguillarum]
MSLPQLYLSDIPEAEKIVNDAGDGSTLFTRDRFGNRIYDPLYLAKKLRRNSWIRVSVKSWALPIATS